jgi:hypothetical protein
MATFPATFPTTALLPVVAELYAGGDWHDITGDVQVRDNGNITITRGLSNEATSIQPSQCTFMLDNRLGSYSPANPAGLYYGTLGRNTPVRLSIGAETDTFTRTVSNGWGTNDSGDLWSFAVWTVSNSAASFAVAGGVGTHTVAGTGAYVASGLSNIYADIDVAVTVSVLPGTSITGGQVEPANILLRGQDSGHYYMLRCTIQPSGAVTLQWMDANNAALNSVATATVTHSASTLRVRAQVEGQTLRGKVWDPSGPEPAGWLTVANYLDSVIGSGTQQLDSPGWVGIRSGVGSGNTNTPVTFSYDNLVLRVPRYSGYLASLVPSSDITGTDRFVNATAASVLRQLNQGQLPVQSCLRHDIPGLSNLVAYWPCEDGANSTSIASAFPGGSPMAFSGSPQFAADTTFVGSSALPVNNNSYWIGLAPKYTSTGTVQVRMLIKFPPAATLTDGTVLFRFWTYGAGSVGATTRWDFYYKAGGGLGVLTVSPTGSVVNDTGSIPFVVDGGVLRVGFYAQQSGSNLNCQISTLAQGASSASYYNYTINSYTVSTCQAVAVGPPGNSLQQTVVGHITVESAATDLFALLNQLNGFVGEYAQARIARLCGYFGIEYNYVGDPSAKAIQMGAQPADTLLNLLTSCAATDGGLLYEAKGSPALVYRTTGAHLNTTPVAVLDVNLNQLSAAPQVTYDDLNLHNDVIAQRTSGSSYEASLTIGALSTAAPPNGVGVYSTTISVNTNSDTTLQDIAGWALHLGTVADARYPQISVNLASTHLTSNAALWWSILGVDPDDFAAVNNLATDQVLLLVRGYTETITQMTYGITWNCAPGSPYVCGTLDDGVSRLDSDGSTLHAAINASATSFQVDISDGALWTTSAGDLPLDIMCGGERMTVGVITGSSSPQTFSSVSRSVNGVIKSHNTGDKISLFQPYYLGLGGL